jgi:S-adenosylmethionine/arginine decarboxylase-like enzyme
MEGYKMLMPQRHSLGLDGFVLSGEGLSIVTQLEHVISSVACLSDMRIINFTCSYIEEDLKKLYSQVFRDEGGVSVQALISTSHICIHCWPNRDFFMFDIVSCKSFSPVDVANYLIIGLGVREIKFCKVVVSGEVNFDAKKIISENPTLKMNHTAYRDTASRTDITFDTGKED